MADAPPDFSLVLGGPLYHFFLRTRLALPPLGRLKRRVIAFFLLTWVPLFAFSLAAGVLLTGPHVPFLYDISTHIRFLVALPLLIIAERFSHERLQPIIAQFLRRDLIAPVDVPRFNAAIASAIRLRNSVIAEVVLLIFCFTVGHVFWEQRALKTATWYATPALSGLQLTPAGFWFAWISMPLFQFIFLRWVYRWLIWTRFLWQVSRCSLAILPTHPDRSGGLGFLSEIDVVFAPILIGEGALLSGVVAGRIFFEGASLLSFKLEIVGLVAFLFALVLGPLCVFAPQLARSKRQGNREYGTLAMRYVGEFDRKWNRGDARPDDSFLGSGDIQSLADMGNSYEVVRRMRSVPFDQATVLYVAAVAVLPIAPLILTLIPFNQLVGKLLQIIF